MAKTIDIVEERRRREEVCFLFVWLSFFCLFVFWLAGCLLVVVSFYHVAVKINMNT